MYNVFLIEKIQVQVHIFFFFVFLFCTILPHIFNFIKVFWVKKETKMENTLIY